MMRINVPFTNLRSDSTVHSGERKDINQESQLIYNEKVNVIKIDSDWAYVEAVEQPYFDKNLGWIGYKGWVESKALIFSPVAQKNEVVVISKWARVVVQEGEKELPFGSIFSIYNTEKDHTIINLPDGTKGRINNYDIAFLSEKNEKLVINSYFKKFVGDPYFWGGRSPLSFCEKTGQSSVDCSGFVNLIYRALGLILPRNASDQYLLSEKITSLQIAIGDLIFSASEAFPNKIDHVMLYLSDNRIVESTMSFGGVRVISCEERFGSKIEEIVAGKPLDCGIVLYFGRFNTDSII